MNPRAQSSEIASASSTTNSEYICKTILDIFMQFKEEYNLSNEDIADTLQHMSEVYTERVSIGQPRTLAIPLHRTSYHCAYLYRYFTAIAYTTKSHWNDFRHFFEAKIQLHSQLRAFFTSHTTTQKFVCIGGGPGTDLIGFQLFLRENNLNMKLNATILDVDDWSKEHEKIIHGFNDGNIIESCQYKYYDFYDVLDENSEIYEILRTADIVSFVKFLSGIGHDQHWWTPAENGKNKLKKLLKLLKPETLVFSMENSGGFYSRDFYRAAALEPSFEDRLTLVAEKKKDDINIGIPYDEIQDYLIAGQNLTATLKVTSRLWTKQRQ